MSDYEAVIQSIQRLISCTTNYLGQTQDKRVVTAKVLAEHTRTALQNKQLIRTFAHSYCLILLSYCYYLSKTGVSDTAIDEIIQTATDKREQDRKQLLPGVISVHGVIVELVAAGWTVHGATELFFLGMLSFLFYVLDLKLIEILGALSLSDLVLFPKHAPLILNHFSTNKASYNRKGCRDFGCTIPDLIASISANDNMEVYNALGYNSCRIAADHDVEPLTQDCVSNSANSNLWWTTVLDTPYRNGKGSPHTAMERIPTEHEALLALFEFDPGRYLLYIDISFC
jgi:hypothetical protein